MNHWQSWAAHALVKARAAETPDFDAIRALKLVEESGTEPYWSLKAFVHRLETQAVSK